MSLFKFKNVLFFTLCLSVTVGCKKFLAERSQTLQYVTTYNQLDEIMVGDGYMLRSNTFTSNTVGNYMPWLNMMDDDVTEAVVGASVFDTRRDVFGFYTYQSKPFVNYQYAPKVDDTWSRFYKHINAVNSVVQKAGEMNDNLLELKRITGEALFLRAGYYFYLVNIYSKAYDPQTAKTDLGVPLKVTSFVEPGYVSRASVDAVYQQIILDLKEAEQDLLDVPAKSINRADVNAVNLLQSRVYLYMQDWENAAASARKVIARKGNLYNLANYTARTSFLATQSPEAIFTQGTNSMVYLMFEGGLTTFKPTTELMNLYDSKDLRKNIFFMIDSRSKYRYAKVYYSPANSVVSQPFHSDNFFLRSSEAYLNLAEAAAMLGNITDANAAIKTLRQARFLVADYQEVNLTGADLVNFIRDERRRELCFEGHRWFDLKRYAVNASYPFSKTISHPYSLAVPGSASLQATLTLLPNDAAYLIPIPDPAIEFNQGALIQNPERPNRQF